MDNKIFTAYYNEGDLVFTSTFVTELDEISVKELNLDKDMEFYNKCLSDDEFLNRYIGNLYCKKLMSLPDEEKSKVDFDYIKNNWNSICEQEKPIIRQYINEQIQYITECSEPIYERRERVSIFFNSIKDLISKEGYLSPNGRIINIGYDIPNEIFIDIYHIFADALCCRFQLNQFDGKYREGMYHCLQYLDYRYHFNNYKKQYPNATEEDIKILNTPNFLDIVTGRQNAYFEVQGVQYKCSAYLDDGVFRLKIDELVLWNISNGSKVDLIFDTKSIWSVDDRYKVKLDATQMACYTFIYNNPDTDIDTIFANKDKFIACINDCDSGSRKFEDYLNKGDKTAFEKGLKKRISEINQKVRPILGMAYTIFNKKVNEKESYYIPISKNIKEEPDDI